MKVLVLLLLCAATNAEIKDEALQKFCSDGIVGAIASVLKTNNGSMKVDNFTHEDHTYTNGKLYEASNVTIANHPNDTSALFDTAQQALLITLTLRFTNSKVSAEFNSMNIPGSIKAVMNTVDVKLKLTIIPMKNSIGIEVLSTAAGSATLTVSDTHSVSNPGDETIGTHFVHAEQAMYQLLYLALPLLLSDAIDHMNCKK